MYDFQDGKTIELTPVHNGFYDWDNTSKKHEMPNLKTTSFSTFLECEFFELFWCFEIYSFRKKN